MAKRKKEKNDQKFFNHKYSNVEVIDIVGNRYLNYGGHLKIEDFMNLKSINLEKLKIISLKIINCSQLNNIKLSKLTELESLSVNNCQGLIELIFLKKPNLTVLEISNCPQLNDIKLSELIKLKSLTVFECPKLNGLNCSSIGLTELEISKLSEVDCSNTLIEILSFNLCPNITKLNCSNNDKLIILDVTNCSKLKELDCTNCSNSNFTRLDLSNCPKDIVVKRPHPNVNIIQDIEDRKTKNLVIVGRTGCGKSALCNVLTNTDEFEESGCSISVTKNFKKKVFEWKGKNFRVVDTVGVWNTKMPLKNVLYKIIDGIYSIPEGISQVLFVFDESFTENEVNIFNLLKDSIFQSDILDYVTIVRTNFSNFKNKDECKRNRDKLQEKNETIAKIIKSCKDIVYVDNPPTNINIVDDDDIDVVETNKKMRARSRTILLDYLDKECQDKYFKIESWNVLSNIIVKYIGENSDKLPEEMQPDPDLEMLEKISEPFCSIL
ncbi:AIG1 family-domain-containing protein [Glomus cerebriforme]|uniref:AIG1 family-domain-containing protein n=1 Tax=Glomus cerebriforme TaxID=658196 RepID=A0A397T1R0_9GLOM|nr:AIG1 family-domain-containing protein [Glomus cerebriforme]